MQSVSSISPFDLFLILQTKLDNRITNFHISNARIFMLFFFYSVNHSFIFSTIKVFIIVFQSLIFRQLLIHN